MAYSILIVDDEADMRKTLETVLSLDGYQISTAENAAQALALFRESEPDIILLDQLLPDMNGLNLFKRFKKLGSESTVIMMSGFGDVQDAVQGMKLGLFDYLKKPFLKEEILTVVKKAVDMRKIKKESEILYQRLEENIPKSVPIFTESPAMKYVMEQLKKVASTNLTTILQGESGTGKEVVARHIHLLSQRAKSNFVTVDCGSLPETLIESELFGYERGAFTGAEQRKLGQFELANEGTIFLDEIGNIPLSVQAKLLRVIQGKKVQHLGGKKEIAVDVRIIVATNISLVDAVKKGKFRDDLYHRLNEFALHLPPLRDRKDDIPLLVNYFLEGANEEFDKKVQCFDSESLDFLKTAPWQGNIRELKNVVKRAVLDSEGEIIGLDILRKFLKIELSAGEKPVGSNKKISETDRMKSQSFAKIQDIPIVSASAPKSYKKFDLNREVKKITSEYEKQVILDALQKAGSNRSKAARLLGIRREDLYYKINKLKIKV